MTPEPILTQMYEVLHRLVNIVTQYYCEPTRDTAGKFPQRSERQVRTYIVRETSTDISKCMQTHFHVRIVMPEQE